MITRTGAKKAREVVFSVLRDACIAGDLSIQDAVAAVKDIFADNAKEFYKIKVAEKPIKSEVLAFASNLPTEISASGEDLVLVRIIWVDASGQQRCRVSALFFFDYLVGDHLKLFYQLCRAHHHGVLSSGMHKYAFHLFKGNFL